MNREKEARSTANTSGLETFLLLKAVCQIILTIGPKIMIFKGLAFKHDKIHFHAQNARTRRARIANFEVAATEGRTSATLNLGVHGLETLFWEIARSSVRRRPEPDFETSLIDTTSLVAQRTTALRAREADNWDSKFTTTP